MAEIRKKENARSHNDLELWTSDVGTEFNTLSCYEANNDITFSKKSSFWACKLWPGIKMENIRLSVTKEKGFKLFLLQHEILWLIISILYKQYKAALWKTKLNSLLKVSCPACKLLSNGIRVLNCSDRIERDLYIDNYQQMWNILTIV